MDGIGHSIERYTYICLSKWPDHRLADTPAIVARRRNTACCACSLLGLCGGRKGYFICTKVTVVVRDLKGGGGGCGGWDE